jgi:hypothetical protein
MADELIADVSETGMTGPESELLEQVYRDQRTRDRVLAEIGKRPDVAVNRLMLIIAEAYLSGVRRRDDEAGFFGPASSEVPGGTAAGPVCSPQRCLNGVACYAPSCYGTAGFARRDDYEHALEEDRRG